MEAQKHHLSIDIWNLSPYSTYFYSGHMTHVLTGFQKVLPILASLGVYREPQAFLINLFRHTFVRKVIVNSNDFFATENVWPLQPLSLSEMYE